MVAKHIHVHLTRDAFVESQHPRKHGEFVKKGTGTSGKSSAGPAAKSSPKSTPKAAPAKAAPAKASPAELHAKHEDIAKSVVAMVKRDPFLGRHASVAEYGNPLIDRKNPDGSVEFSIRDLGQWENPPEARNEEDYDWQVPTQKTKEAVKKLKEHIEKTYGVKVEVSGSEKNYTDFTIGPK